MDIYNMEPKDDSMMLNLFTFDRRPAMISESERSLMMHLASESNQFVVEELGILMQGSTKEGDPVYFCFAKEGEAKDGTKFFERFYRYTGEPGNQTGRLMFFVLGKNPQRYVMNKYNEFFQLYDHCCSSDDICYGNIRWHSDLNILSYSQIDNGDGEFLTIFYYIQSEKDMARLEINGEHSVSVCWADTYIDGKWYSDIMTDISPEMSYEEVKTRCDELITSKKEEIENEDPENSVISVFDLEYEDMSADLSEELDRLLPEEEFGLRDRRLISLRLGLDDLPRSRKEVGLEFNISEDYVYTIDAKLMKYICESIFFKEFVLRLTAPEKYLSEEQIIQIEHLLRFEQQVIDRISDEESEEKDEIFYTTDN